jgi:hypothetical protein
MSLSNVPLNPVEQYRWFQEQRKIIEKTTRLTPFNLQFMDKQVERLDEIEKSYYRQALESLK